MSILAKYFKGFPEKQALKGTVATVVAYKGSKYISNMIGESMSKEDPKKKELWEFIGSVGSVVGSMFAYTKIRSKDIGFGLVLGSGVNAVDKLMLLPSIKKNIPDKMQPLFSGPNDVDISSDDYMRRVSDARYNLSEDDVKSIVNAAKVNGYLDGFGGDLGEDVIVITPEERAAMLDNSMDGYDPEYEEYDRPAGLGEDQFAGEEEFA